MTSIDKPSTISYQEEVRVDYIDKIEDMLLISDSNEMDNRIFKNMLNITKTLKTFYKRLSENFELTKEETDILLYCLKFIDTLNLFISNQSLESVLRLMEDIHEIANMVNNLPQQDEVLRKIRYTEKSIIYFKKKLFKYMFFGDGNQLGKEIEKYLVHISMNGNFDHRTFKQMQNIFYVVQGKIEESYRKQIQAIFNEMKQGNIRSKNKKFSNYFDDYTDYTDYKNYDQSQTDYYDNYYNTNSQYNRNAGSNSYNYNSGNYRQSTGSYGYRNSYSYYDNQEAFGEEQNYEDEIYEGADIQEADSRNPNTKRVQNYYNENFYKNNTYYDDKRNNLTSKPVFDNTTVAGNNNAYGYSGNIANDYTSQSQSLTSAANSLTPVKKNKGNKAKKGKQKGQGFENSQRTNSDNSLIENRQAQIETDYKKGVGAISNQSLPVEKPSETSTFTDNGTEIISVIINKKNYNYNSTNTNYRQNNNSNTNYKQYNNNSNTTNNNYNPGNNYNNNFNNNFNNNTNQNRNYGHAYETGYYNNAGNRKMYKNEDVSSQVFKKGNFKNNYNNSQQQQYDNTSYNSNNRNKNNGYYNNQLRHEFVDLDELNKLKSSDQVTAKLNQQDVQENKQADIRYQSDSGLAYNHLANTRNNTNFGQMQEVVEVFSEGDKKIKGKKNKDQFKSDDTDNGEFEEIENEEYEDEESSELDDNEMIQEEFDNFIQTAKYENMGKMIYNDDYNEFEDETKNNKVIFDDDNNDSSTKIDKPVDEVIKEKNIPPSEENMKETTRGFLNSLKNIDPKVLLEIKNKLSQDNDNFKKGQESDEKKQSQPDTENPQPDFNELYQNHFYQNQNMNKMSIQNYMYTNYAHFFFRGRDSNIHREYFALKCLEQENPAMVYKNLDAFEDKILVPIYQRINFNVNKRKGVYFYTYSKYQRLIYRVLNKDKVLKKVKPYGSYMNNFLIDSGDIDICIVSKIGIVEFSNFLDKIKEEIIVQVNFNTYI